MILNRFVDEHLEPFEKLIKYKKPIFIDKPITLTTEDAEKISEISNREEIQTSSNSPLEFSKEFVELQSYIKRIDGRLNIIFQGPMECNDLGSDIRFKSPLFYGIHIFEMISRVIVENSFVINKIHRNGKLLTIDCDKVAFEVYLHKDSCEFYSISTISIEEQKNFDVNLDGSYYDGFTDYLVNFFLSKFKGKDLLKKSLRAMEFSESYK